MRHKEHSDAAINKGAAGEKLIAEFFDNQFSKHFSFSSPKTKENAEIADVLVWFNHVALLVEVKTRDSSTKSANDWACSKIQEAVEQLKTNKRRIDNREIVNLHNDYYHVPLAHDGLNLIFGLVVLVSQEPITITPSQAVPEIYRLDFPLQVLIWNDLRKMTREIDTIPDFLYYISDRYQYTKNLKDIPLGYEMRVLGKYKLLSNRFPECTTDFGEIDYWEIYLNTMTDEITARDVQNEDSKIFDYLVSKIPQKRRLHDGQPIGLYFAWEMAALSRRQRAMYAEKLLTVPDWFLKGKTSRQFALQNQATNNWLVFYFAKAPEREISDQIIRLVELKLIKEVRLSAFVHGVYGLGFQVEDNSGHRLRGLTCATFSGASEVEKLIDEGHLEEAIKVWGTPADTQKTPIEEFPSSRRS